MKKEIAMEWIARLRSGNYVQGQSYLRTKDDKYCCLGLLHDIVAPSNWHLDIPGKAYGSANSYGEENSALPPNTTCKAAEMELEYKLPEVAIGLTNWERTMLGNVDDEIPLWQLNDQLGLSFERIAELIELNWERM